MTTKNLPGSDAARHGTGDADLTVMFAAHDSLRRDLTQLAKAASSTDLPDPARRASVLAGWETFKRQLHMHHTAEDALVWPALRDKLAGSDSALSVLHEMEEEHKVIDPLLAAVDRSFEHPEGNGIADTSDALATTLTAHLKHEELDALPLIGSALTASEWRKVGIKITLRNGLSASGELYAWMTDDTSSDRAAEILGTLPPPARMIYRARWKPRYARTSRW